MNRGTTKTLNLHSQLEHSVALQGAAVGLIMRAGRTCSLHRWEKRYFKPLGYAMQNSRIIGEKSSGSRWSMGLCVKDNNKPR